VVGLWARLKLRLIAGNLRGSTGRQIGFAVSVACALAFGFGGFLGAAQLRVADDGIGAGVAVIVFTVLTIGWVVLPVMAFGVDETLDPSRLALLPLTRRDLAVGMFASSAVGLWPAASLLVLLGLVAGVAPDPVTAVVGVAAALLQLALCLTVSRAVTTSLARVLRSRRGRDFMLAVGLVLTLLAQIPNLVLNGTLRGSPDRADFDRIVRMLEWGPPGAAARALADGNPLWLAPLTVSVALIGWWWLATLDRLQVTVDTSTQATEVRRRRWNPAGQLGGVTVKELTYLRRDPRRVVGLVSSLALTVVLTFSWGRNGSGPVPPVAFGALVLGMQNGNAFGGDGGALWMNAVTWCTPLDVRTDLAGRHLAYLLVATPTLVLMAVASALLSSSPGDIPLAVLVGLGVLGVALGVGSVTSVLLPYALPDRINAFSGAAPGQGGAAFVSSMSLLISTAVLAVPIGALVGLGAPLWLMVLGPAYGLLLAWAGRRLAASRAYPRLPELVASVSRAT
jgi:ABC-2 type transport system permease protein